MSVTSTPSMVMPFKSQLTIFVFLKKLFWIVQSSSSMLLKTTGRRGRSSPVFIQLNEAPPKSTALISAPRRLILKNFAPLRSMSSNTVSDILRWRNCEPVISCLSIFNFSAIILLTPFGIFSTCSSEHLLVQ